MPAFDFEKYYFPEYYSITHTDNKKRRVNLEAVVFQRFFKQILNGLVGGPLTKIELKECDSTGSDGPHAKDSSTAF